jgi:hypothetical protein
MELTMVTAAERHRELIADLAPHCGGLRKLQMVCIRRTAAAGEASWVLTNFR